MKKNDIPVIDLHSDLLAYLIYKPGRTIDDAVSRSSYPHLAEGGVRLQTLAISSMTDNKSVEYGRAEVAQFAKLLSDHPLQFSSLQPPLSAQSKTVQIIAAFENASTFASEDEPLFTAIERLESYLKLLGPVFYISMTWDTENRFGGGNRSTIGLKEDGKRLLEWMSGKRIAIDLSHTSDWLAHDLIHFIDDNRLSVPLIASHSNFRAITDQPRNLTDDLAKEIIKRGGLIGLNLFAPFSHKTDPSVLLRHVEYALNLGAENALCFGADFFCDQDAPNLIEKYQTRDAYFPEYGNSSTYPLLLNRLSNKLNLSEEKLLKIACQNAQRFLQEQILK